MSIRNSNNVFERTMMQLYLNATPHFHFIRLKTNISQLQHQKTGNAFITTKTHVNIWRVHSSPHS